MVHMAWTHAARRGPSTSEEHSRLLTRVHRVRAHSRRSAAWAARDRATAQLGPPLLQHPGKLNTQSASRLQGSPSTTTLGALAVVAVAVELTPSLAAVDESSGRAISAASSSEDCGSTTAVVLAAASSAVAALPVAATGAAEIDDCVALHPNIATTLTKINTRIAPGYAPARALRNSQRRSTARR